MNPRLQFLLPDMVVQISPEWSNKIFAGCFMVVTKVIPYGAQGYVTLIGENNQPGGHAFLRVEYEDMELVGMAAWISTRD